MTLEQENTVLSIIEDQLANYSHNTWSKWMKYMFATSVPYNPDKVQAEKRNNNGK